MSWLQREVPPGQEVVPEAPLPPPPPSGVGTGGSEFPSQKWSLQPWSSWSRLFSTFAWQASCLAALDGVVLDLPPPFPPPFGFRNGFALEEGPHLFQRKSCLPYDRS